VPQPTGFKLIDGQDLRISWNDGHITRFALQYFRDECPCAGCQGESDIFGEVKMPMQLPVMKPGKYEIKQLTPVGNYAVAAVWADGHDSGIYSWEYLLEMEKRADAASSSPADAPTT